jgi:hypothetical protein
MMFVQAWADVPSATDKNTIILEGDVDADELRLIQVSTCWLHDKQN